MEFIDANISRSEISDKIVLEEFKNPNKYKKRSLYPLMAYRAIDNLEIRDCLFALILDKEARRDAEFGFITHAWLPALFILEYGDEHLKSQLKSKLRMWTINERELFLNYVKSEQDYYDLLSDIV